MTERMTIKTLAATVAEALSVDYEAPDNGQVRSVPDQRSIRYYTTLGLLDPPADMEGRTAIYGRHHVMQLVAIKRLQGEGLSLAEIQERLTGASNRTLAKIARLPPLDSKKKRRRDTKAPARAFWRQPPAAPAAPPPPVDAERLMSGVPLSDAVTLLLQPAKTVGEADVAAIETAAAPLLRLLESRGLI